ncbi:hypothetical protein PMAYCL1PPCAC_00729, partial [Pristionchus mayeri]
MPYGNMVVGHQSLFLNAAGKRVEDGVDQRVHHDQILQNHAVLDEAVVPVMIDESKGGVEVVGRPHGNVRYHNDQGGEKDAGSELLSPQRHALRIRMQRADDVRLRELAQYRPSANF